MFNIPHNKNKYHTQSKPHFILVDKNKKPLSFPKTQKPVRKHRWQNYKPVGIQKINNLNDLINMAWNYTNDRSETNNFDWFTLWKLIPALTELQNIVGMNNLKQDIVDLVLYYLLGLHLVPTLDGENTGEMLHAVIAGSPGTGKTTVAKIIAKIYCSLGFLSSDNIIIAKREDFIGKWIGHSETQTMDILKSAKGGVLFIDEAYSMGQENNTDNFSKASVDIITSFLSENTKDFVCIIAGYEEELEKCFFSINPGLERRFPWRFKIDSYEPKHLHEMFVKMVHNQGWYLDDSAITVNFFEVHKDEFPFNGGDIRVFVTKCKITHTRRIFLDQNPAAQKRILSFSDIEEGFLRYKKHKKNKVQMPQEVQRMYI